MNALLTFFKSKDGIVVIAALVLLAVVTQITNEYNPWVNLLARVGNIAIFLYIIWRVGGKKLIASLGQRRTDIAAELESLARKKQEAEAQIQEIRERIASLDAEREAILEESRRQGEILKANILEAANAEADRIRQQAARSADNETRSMLKELREKIADEIIDDVEGALIQRLDKKSHDKLIQEALKKVVLN